MSKAIEVQCNPCVVCKKASKMFVDPEAYDNYMIGVPVQAAFPNMPAEQREMLITGTHPACWNEIFPPEDE